MYDRFTSHVKGESVDKATFHEILKQSGVENDAIIDHWFDICDPDHDGLLVFKFVIQNMRIVSYCDREFLTAVTLMERGSWEDRAKCTVVSAFTS